MSAGSHGPTSWPMPLRMAKRQLARGAIMLEVMLSIGLFVGAAAFCLGATKSIPVP